MVVLTASLLGLPITPWLWGRGMPPLSPPFLPSGLAMLPASWPALDSATCFRGRLLLAANRADLKHDTGLDRSRATQF